MNKRDSNIFTACGSLILVAALAIAGCNGREGNERIATPSAPCPDPCNVDIDLPVDFGQKPQVPPVTVVKPGSEVNFKILEGNPQTDDERTVLSFDQAALVDANGNKLFTLELTGGDNKFTAGQGVCKEHTDPEKNGCRYVVINVGRPGRPSVISSPRFVIK